MSTDLIKHTEAAMALLDGKIAEVIYLPPDVRKNKVRLKASGHATTAPFSPKEQLDRIIAADPVGFLLAIMNGQPVVTFDAHDTRVKVDAAKLSAKARKALGVKLGVVDGYEIRAIVHVPTIDDRKEVAKFLTPYAVEKRKKSGGPLGDSGDGGEPDAADDAFEQIAAARAAQAKGTGNGPTQG